jgi:hypothetical protein
LGNTKYYSVLFKKEGELGMSKPMKVNLPNFMIVGASKCGTTALADYLSQHPEVYFCPLKEPKFISSHFIKFPLRGPGDDFIESFTVKSINEYVGLFSRVKNHRAVGEGSVENLYYAQKAIPLIMQYLGDPKIVIILRDPVHRAFSAYKQLVRDHREKQSFERGLVLEKLRRRKNWEYLWYYTDVGFYSQQVRAYMQSFSQVKVMLFGELVHNPSLIMKDLFGFLEVDDTFKPQLRKRLNRSGIVKAGLWDMVFKGRRRVVGSLYKFLALHGLYDSRILYLIERVRHRHMRQIVMSPNTQQRLRATYKPDVLRTQEIIGRDLGQWLDEEASRITDKRMSGSRRFQLALP